jgi:hypothetical protein
MLQNIPSNTKRSRALDKNAGASSSNPGSLLKILFY